VKYVTEIFFSNDYSNHTGLLVQLQSGEKVNSAHGCGE